MVVMFLFQNEKIMELSEAQLQLFIAQVFTRLGEPETCRNPDS